MKNPKLLITLLYSSMQLKPLKHFLYASVQGGDYKIMVSASEIEEIGQKFLM
jgi:hypothetical protein